MLIGEAVDGGGVVAEDDVDEALRAAPLSELDEVVKLPAGHVGEAGGGESLDDAAACEDGLEHAELGVLDRLAEVGHFESVAEVGAVGGVLLHRLGVGDALEGLAEDFAFGNERFEEGGVELFDEVEDVVLVGEAHFEV